MVKIWGLTLIQLCLHTIRPQSFAKPNEKQPKISIVWSMVFIAATCKYNRAMPFHVTYPITLFDWYWWWWWCCYCCWLFSCAFSPSAFIHPLTRFYTPTVTIHPVLGYVGGNEKWMCRAKYDGMREIHNKLWGKWTCTFVYANFDAESDKDSNSIDCWHVCFTLFTWLDGC